ncbi:MAG: A/G-specific adenine glycosylase [Gemmatimonadota bacterium]
MSKDHRRLRSALLEHYDQHGRDLPWRADSDPYRILVSEVMLQQTRVETVRGYYTAWLQRFPDLDSLASAPEPDVLKAWEGLGYYRRARNLHAAAREVRERFDGRLPTTVEELRELPGVGEYTAGAVASIAFDEAVPAVDGNVRRVLSRWYDVPDPSARWLRDTAGALVDDERPGDWNQALMELGATICTPRSARCDACPVDWACAARAAGTVDDRPARKGKPTPRRAVFALAVLEAPGGSVLLERRPTGGLLGGMWAFPEREVADGRDAHAAAKEVAVELLGVENGLSASAPRALPPVRHRFSHIDATYVPWLFGLEMSNGDGDGDRAQRPGTSDGRVDGRELRWANAAERADMALPVAQRAVIEGVQ